MGLSLEYGGMLERRYFIIHQCDRATLHSKIQAEVQTGLTTHSDEWWRVNLYSFKLPWLYTPDSEPSTKFCLSKHTSTHTKNESLCY